MTIQDLGSIGEVIGALATVATLAYLAIQIRANTRATLAEARRTTLHHRTSGLSEIIANESVARIFEKGLADRKSLSSTERIRFDTLLSRLVADCDLLVREQHEGFAETDMVDPSFVATTRLLRSPGGRQFWGQLRGSFTPAFQKRVDAVLDADKRRSLEPLKGRDDR